ncbi:uncharacterized protein LOC129595936 [Paramacrobiotus metropolitanus]|uniref:uncharacterized protein LOC129595936 n=1 Tax=Paramacrobiotus metropolitanus TaxID=2943436 RepID=UPI0024457E31|nr:uncharacterized protein LOC129595936 [Paramacrobiotus metropolitanus]
MQLIICSCLAVVLLALQGFTGARGATGLQCYECYNNTQTGEDCRHVGNQARKPCPPGHDDVCVTNINANTYTTGMVVVYSRYCARLTDPAGRPVGSLNASPRQDCNSVVDGHKMQIRCSCNTNLCNSHDRIFLPDGRYISSGATAPAALTGSTLLLLAVSRLFA